MDEKTQTQPCTYELSKMSARHIYEALCKELDFNTMINVYKRIKNKMETLEDKIEHEECCSEGYGH